ncbi:MAG: ABC exporter membrane fusion protein [Xenococcaceae cyanobacterium MO_207.B15]|nr:ABC exporter membrane fusion protein [Xenococcaceae cyanobacterium MO_207.B15]
MQDAKANYAKSSQTSVSYFSALFTTLILIMGGITAYSLWQLSQTEVESNPVPTLPEIKTVTALGHLEPSGEVIQVSASSSTERVEELLVKKGDRVAKGQIIAILNSRNRLQAALKQAEERVKVAQANLAQVKAGAKTGEIEAQKAVIARIKVERSNDIAAQKAIVARLSAELKNAQVEYQRYQTLYTEGAISASEKDSKQLSWETAQQQLEEAKANLTRIYTTTQEQIKESKATLKQIAEVRSVDVDVAAAEVREATAAVAIAQAELDLAYIKAPQASQILDILTRPGEIVSSDGIARIGQTSQMYAVAEIYESDIGKVKVGQQVKVTSNAVSGELHGTVERIGLEIQRQEVINTDPTANIDAKVVEVRVRLDEESSQKVAGLTNLLVNVKITL